MAGRICLCLGLGSDSDSDSDSGLALAWFLYFFRTDYDPVVGSFILCRSILINFLYYWLSFNIILCIPHFGKSIIRHLVFNQPTRERSCLFYKIYTENIGYS